MRRPMLVAAMVVVLCGSVAAGTTFDLGLKVGGGMSKFNISGHGMRMGLDGGAFFNVRFNPKLSVQAEVLYTQKGSKFSVAGVDLLEWKMSYIEIPILVKQRIATSGKVKPVFMAGPAIGMLTGANRINCLTDEEVDVKDGFESMDIGLAVGAGADVLMGTNGMLVVDARFTISLTNNNVDEFVVGDQTLRNWNITFMVGYGFELGKKGQ